MNQFNRRYVLMGIIGLIVLSVPLTLSLLQNRQETRSRAGAATVLSLTPVSSTKNVGETVSFDIMVNPGTNLVTFVKFQLIYDATKLEPITPEPFVLNTTAFATKDGPVITPGSLTGSASIGADPTKTIQSLTKIGTVQFRVIGSSNGSSTTVSFGAVSQALSSGPNDQSKENVLASTIPATIFANGTAANSPTPAATACSTYPARFVADLKGSEEVPGSGSTATGKFTMEMTSATSMTSKLEVTGLQVNQITNSHIHSPAARGANAPTKITIFDNPGSFQSPHNFTTSSVTADVLNDIKNGQAYVNVHTNQFPNGEIRGQLTCSTGDPVTQQPSPTPSGTHLSFELLLHGVGSAGDNPNPTQSDLSNKNPIHPQRNLHLEIYDTENKLVTSVSGALSLNYNQANGSFMGKLSLPSSFREGNYNLKVKTDRYLKRRIPGILNIKTYQDNPVPKVDLVAGDVSGDNILNIIDYNAFLDCGYGQLDPLPIVDPNSLFNKTECQAHKPAANVDIDDNNVINSFDYNLFLRELSVQNGD